MRDCDVLVIGAGIAGTTAALAAANTGARIILASTAHIFSGSSFFGGTWGLGLIGPQDISDEAELTQTILSVGRGMAVPTLVTQLVKGIEPAVQQLESRGVHLRHAQAAEQQEFIPCFDHKQRSWQGLGRSAYRKAIADALEIQQLMMLPYHELIDLVEDDCGICGALLYDSTHSELRQIKAGAVVLATGGFGGLFEHTLTMPDVLGTAQAIALKHGAALINAEFIQIMPGLLSPKKGIVFNEKSFRFARLEGFEEQNFSHLMTARAGHGPFSASLPDHLVDLAIARKSGGAKLSYSLPDVLPEFMQTYADWFYHSFHCSPFKNVRIAPYAHAANGGIYIDSSASCGIPGLFACGEATGGMHGADRIGGLSSANCLVFGEIAGQAAAAYAQSHTTKMHSIVLPTKAARITDCQCALKHIRHIMDANCLLGRESRTLTQAQQQLSYIQDQLSQRSTPSSDPQSIALTTRVSYACLNARALVAAMLARPESRGSHFRHDFPMSNSACAQAHTLTLCREEFDITPIVF